MHICHVCPYDLSVPGGVRTHILDLCATLRDKGHQVTLVGSTNGKTIETDLPILDVGSGWRMPLWGTVIDVLSLSSADKSDLSTFFEENRVDVLHFHTPWTPLMSIQLLKLVRSLPQSIRPKLVATFHDTPPDSLWGRFLGRYIMPSAARVLLQKFDRIISVSASQKTFISRFSDKKIDVIPNGFRFCPEELNTKLSNVPNPRELPQTILFLGRLEPRKGVMHALKVYQRLTPRFPQLKLIIAGEGKSRKEAEAYVRRYGLHNVYFVGYVDEAEKRRLFRTSDVYIAPALYGESFGIVLLEALAAGTPVAGYGNSGYKSVMADCSPENFPEPGDLTALAARVDVILADEIYRAKIIEKGFSHARKFDWNEVANRVIEVYET